MLIRKCLVKWYPLSPSGERVWGMRLKYLTSQASSPVGEEAYGTVKYIL